MNQTNNDNYIGLTRLLHLHNYFNQAQRVSPAIADSQSSISTLETEDDDIYVHCCRRCQSETYYSEKPSNMSGPMSVCLSDACMQRFINKLTK